MITSPVAEIDTTPNPCQTEFILGDMKIYLCFLPHAKVEKVEVLKSFSMEYIALGIDLLILEKYGFGSYMPNANSALNHKPTWINS